MKFLTCFIQKFGVGWCVVEKCCVLDSSSHNSLTGVAVTGSSQNQSQL